MLYIFCVCSFILYNTIHLTFCITGERYSGRLCCICDCARFNACKPWRTEGQQVEAADKTSVVQRRKEKPRALVSIKSRTPNGLVHLWGAYNCGCPTASKDFCRDQKRLVRKREKIVNISWVYTAYKLPYICNCFQPFFLKIRLIKK